MEEKLYFERLSDINSQIAKLRDEYTDVSGELIDKFSPYKAGDKVIFMRWNEEKQGIVESISIKNQAYFYTIRPVNQDWTRPKRVVVRPVYAFLKDMVKKV